VFLTAATELVGALVNRRPAAALVDQGSAAVIAASGHQSLRLPQTHTQHARR